MKNILVVLAFLGLIIGVPAIVEQIDISTKFFLYSMLALLAACVTYFIIKKISKIIKKFLKNA